MRESIPSGLFSVTLEILGGKALKMSSSVDTAAGDPGCCLEYFGVIYRLVKAVIGVTYIRPMSKAVALAPVLASVQRRSCIDDVAHVRRYEWSYSPWPVHVEHY